MFSYDGTTWRFIGSEKFLKEFEEMLDDYAKHMMKKTGSKLEPRYYHLREENCPRGAIFRHDDPALHAFHRTFGQDNRNILDNKTPLLSSRKLSL